MHVKFDEPQTSSLGVEVRKKRMSVQMLSSSLDHGEKLRSPSPIAPNAILSRDEYYSLRPHPRGTFEPRQIKCALTSLHVAVGLQWHQNSSSQPDNAIYKFTTLTFD
ncbi:hypothetical protein TNCV_82811 [Trichonephila clavipes]|nr:hypothetical protein TNCV_82811 [Trichonephila clavipes]